MMNEKNNIVAQGRGNYRRYADDSFEFTPQGKGEPMYQEQKKYKNGVSVATTKGATGKKYVKIAVPTDTPDVFHACVDKLGEVFKEERHTLSVIARGRQLMKADDAMMVLNQKKGLLVFDGVIDLSQTPNYQNQLFNLFNKMNQCLAINETLLKSAVLAQQKSSSK